MDLLALTPWHLSLHKPQYGIRSARSAVIPAMRNSQNQTTRWFFCDVFKDSFLRQGGKLQNPLTLAIVVYACNPSAWILKQGNSEFETSLSYIARPKTNNKKTESSMLTLSKQLELSRWEEMFVRHSYGHRAITAYLLNLDSYLYSFYDICFGNKHNLRMYIQVQHISPNPSKVSSKNRGALLPPGEMKCLACQKLYFS